MKIKWHLETGLVGCDLEGEVDVEDNATEAEIEEACREDMWNYMSWTWRKAKEHE